MSSTPLWANILVGAGGLGAFSYPAAALAGRWFKRNTRQIAEEVVDEKLQPNTDATEDIKERVIRIEAQFGPNGGGLRQAVNEVQIAVAELRGELRSREKR